MILVRVTDFDNILDHSCTETPIGQTEVRYRFLIYAGWTLLPQLFPI